jgi:hypothetical protein
MKNEEFCSLSYSRDLGARGLFQAVSKVAGETEMRKKISEIGFSWKKENLNFSFMSFYSF